MQAWKDAEGRYTLIDETLSSETYQLRDRIKQLGGRWDPGVRHWRVPAEAVDVLKAKRVFGVIHEGYCHEPMAFRYVGEDEVERGVLKRAFCSYCDSHHSNWTVAIIEVCGEPDVARAVYEAEFAGKIGGMA